MKRKTTSELLGTMNFPQNKNLDRLGDGGAFSEKTRQSADLAIERERYVTSRYVTSDPSCSKDAWWYPAVKSLFIS